MSRYLYIGVTKIPGLLGDDDQYIYGFRGADPAIMLRLSEDYPELETLNLKLNYRSAAEVVSVSQKVIKNNKNRYSKQQYPVTEEKGSVNAVVFADHIKEAEYVADRIGELLSRNKDMTVGILYRTSKCADHLEAVLRNRSMAYERRDSGKNYFDQENIKDIIAYFYLAAGNKNRKHLFRILNRPQRGLSRESFYYDEKASFHDALTGYYRGDEEKRAIIDKLFLDIAFIKDLPPQAAVTYIMKGIGYERYMGRFDIDEKNGLKAEEGEAYKSVQSFISICRRHPSIGSFLSFYEEYLMHLENREAGKEKSKSGGIPVMQTVHASKGLEYDAVFIIGLEEGLFPHKKAVSAVSIEEERRLFYVALTRAKREIYLCGRKLDGYGKRESRFLHETGVLRVP